MTVVARQWWKVSCGIVGGSCCMALVEGELWHNNGGSYDIAVIQDQSWHDNDGRRAVAGH